jgi:peptide/nickel transport system permease protein
VWGRRKPLQKCKSIIVGHEGVIFGMVLGIMWRYICKRLLEMIPTTFGVLVLSFILFYVVGGSPAQTVLGQHASQQAIAAFDAANGYDLPLFFGSQYEIDALRKDAQGATELAFPLQAGTYQLPGATLVTLREIEGNAIQRHLQQTEIEVQSGWQITAIEGATAVYRKTRHFFDSQFLRYLNNLIHLDLGTSLETKQPVTTVLAQGLLPTLSLSVPILFFGAILGVTLGLLCAARQGGLLDRGVLAVSTLLMSINYVVWILLGQYLLGFRWPLFPIWGYESAFYLVLPVVIGVAGSLGPDVRFYRAAILDEVYKPYVRTAVSKGVSPARVLFVHVLRNALIPVVTYISLSIPYLFTGSLLLESFFGIPGLGSISINAINSADMSVVRAVVIFGALIYQCVNLLTDIAYGWLDPRVRFAS